MNFRLSCLPPAASGELDPGDVKGDERALPPHASPRLLYLNPSTSIGARATSQVACSQAPARSPRTKLRATPPPKLVDISPASPMMPSTLSAACLAYLQCSAFLLLARDTLLGRCSTGHPSHAHTRHSCGRETSFRADVALSVRQSTKIRNKRDI